jgi:superfamily II DNA helicase RecQ
MRALLRVLREFSSASLSSPPSLPPTAIFAATRASCERTASFLCSAGMPAVALHGGCSVQHALHQQLLLQKRDISCIGASGCGQLPACCVVTAPCSCDRRHE